MSNQQNIPDPALQEKLFHYLWQLVSEGSIDDDVTEAAKQIHAAHARSHEYGRGEDVLRAVAQQHAIDGDYVYAFEALLQWAFLREFRDHRLRKLLEPLEKVGPYISGYQSPYR